MTRQLDLNDGRPVWMTYRAPVVAVRRLMQDIKCDVLVVGSGVSGAMVAESLTAAGLDVVVIDRRSRPTNGSTVATTALVQFEIDQPLSALRKKIGKTEADRVWQRSRNAVFNLKARIDDLSIACDLTTRMSLLIAGNKMGPGDLRKEAELRRAAGIYSRYMSASELQSEFGIKRRGAILSTDNLAINPRKLTSRLHTVAQERGARYYGPCKATALTDLSQTVLAVTEAGRTIEASHVVLATGYELLDPAPHTGHRVVSTWAIATKPQRSELWPHEAFIWEASDPYLYMRTLPDGRVICGGEDEDFSNDEKREDLLRAKTDRIARKLKTLMPRLDVKPEFRWAAAFGVTETGLPWIGALPGHPRIFAMMGYGGNGITYSRIGAEIITGEIVGTKDNDANLFAFASTTGLLRRLLPNVLP